MYRINNDKLTLTKLPEITFKQENMKERQHIQQWIKSEAENGILDEPLLIIQEEFSDWNKSSERLDLLALDKEKKLVIIENKRDDSGKDVTLQSIKYASYCATFNTKDILRVYQDYLNKTGRPNDNALSNIRKFLAYDDENAELILNEGSTQRIIIIANNFRIEVTSAVLWLTNFGIDIKCFEIKPFSDNDNLYIQIQQIIPVKDAEEYTNRINNKNKEDAQYERLNNETKLKYIEFWKYFLQHCEKKLPNFEISNSPSNRSYSHFPSSIKYTGFALHVLNNNCRVDLYINSHSNEIYELLYSKKDELESESGLKFTWHKYEDKIQSKISVIPSELDFHNKDNWDNISNYFVVTIKNFQKALSLFKKEIETFN